MHKIPVIYKKLLKSIFYLILFICIMILLFKPWPEQSYYEIKYNNHVCFRAHSKYRYLTCSPVEVLINNELTIIPSDFDTDLASIPNFLWPFMSPAYSAFIAPSILHDYLYECPNGRSREEVDDIFYYALKEQKLDTWTAWKMWAAVRVFGEEYFNKGGECIYVEMDKEQNNKI